MMINILHLYSETLDLYGDFFNIVAVKQRIEEMGYSCTIEKKEMGDTIDFGRYQMVYIGHGKAKNLSVVSEHFCEYGNILKELIEKGLVVLSIGNSRLLFGESFEDYAKQTKKGIGLFPYTGVETGNVFVSDVVSSPVFDESIRCYGFINRTAHIAGNHSHPLFKLEKGKGDDATDSVHEGNHYKNFFGTWQTGPILVRNPKLLKAVLKSLLGEDYIQFDCDMEQKALDLTLIEFDK